ncbi:Pentatricopeptide repeat-containing protein, mitochondrial [Glycine soja]
MHSMLRLRNALLLRIRNPIDAIVLFNCMIHELPTPSISLFNHVLRSLVKMKHCPTKISLSKHLELRRIKPNIVTLNTLIDCFCHFRQMSSAFSVLGKILKLGYQPNDITFTILIKGLCLNGEVKKVLHFHDKVVAQGFWIKLVILSCSMGCVS